MSSTTTMTRSPSPASGSADIAAMRALLERYSPTGHTIVRSYEALPRRFVVGTSTITVAFAGDFGNYFDDGAPEKLVDYMDTAVHEVYHGWSSVMGYQLLVETGTPLGAGAEALYVGQEPLLVLHGATFPAREMESSFPADARTYRYSVYVNPSQPSQSTQQEGVFGLLDEWTAYYHGGRTIVDFWPWVRDESPVNEQLLVTYVTRFHTMWVAYAEFKLFILHYLRHARDHHPDVYRKLLANQGFRRAFVACDDAWSALLTGAGTLEPTVHAFARGRGLNAALVNGQLTLDGAPFTTRDDAYRAVLHHLDSAPYRELAAELRR